MRKAFGMLISGSSILCLCGCGASGARFTKGPEVSYVSSDGNGAYKVHRCRLQWESPLGEVKRTDCRETILETARLAD